MIICLGSKADFEEFSFFPSVLLYSILLTILNVDFVNFKIYHSLRFYVYAGFIFLFDLIFFNSLCCSSFQNLHMLC